MDWIAILAGIFTLIGVAMLIAAVRQFGRRRDFIRYSATVFGTIIALTENREGGEITHFPKIRFQAASGREITFESAMGSSLATHRVGDVVTVRYRVDQPYQAEIDSYTTLSLGARYRLRMAGQAVTLQANLDNATDRDYWATAGNSLLGTGAPRTLRVGARIDL